MEKRNIHEEVPRWAFQALLWVGGSIWGILFTILAYMGMQFDSRLTRIEDILLHRPTVSSVLSESRDSSFITQETDHPPYVYLND